MSFPNYEGYEELGSFTDPGLLSYRKMLLDKTKPQLDFIEKHIYDNLERQISVAEVGSGNGRLLIGGLLRGIFYLGVGIEASTSRTEFARRWAKDLGFPSKLHMSNLQVSKDHMPYFYGHDLAVCITGCVQYFDSENVVALLEAMCEARYSLFELYKRPKMGLSWKRFDDADTWKYILDDYEDHGEFVTHKKTFIRRDGFEDQREENLHYYTLPQFTGLLKDCGFQKIVVARENSTSMVVLAR